MREHDHLEGLRFLHQSPRDIHAPSVIERRNRIVEDDCRIIGRAVDLCQKSGQCNTPALPFADNLGYHPFDSHSIRSRRDSTFEQRSHFSPPASMVLL